MALVGTKELAGVPVEFHVGMSGGWAVYEPAVEGEDTPLHQRHIAGGDTVEKAEANARNELAKRKVKVAVNFFTEEGEPGIAHGKHARTRKLLVRINGESQQIDSYRSVLRADTPKDVVEHLAEIREEQSKLRSEEFAIKKEWKMDLSKAVDEAIKAAVEAKEAKAA